MKVITIKQPFASLIYQNIKPIENRSWTTKIRGKVLVHAASSSCSWHKVLNYLTPAMKEFAIKNKWTGTWLKNLPTGCIIGSVEIIDCVVNDSSIWAEKTPIAHLGKLTIECQKPIYNWVLANAILFPEPIPAKGKLSFWDYPNILAEPEEEGGEMFCHCQLSVKENSQVVSMIDHFTCRYCGGRWYK